MPELPEIELYLHALEPLIQREDWGASGAPQLPRGFLALPFFQKLLEHFGQTGHDQTRWP